MAADKNMYMKYAQNRKINKQKNDAAEWASFFIIR